MVLSINRLIKKLLHRTMHTHIRLILRFLRGIALEEKVPMEAIGLKTFSYNAVYGIKFFVKDRGERLKFYVTEETYRKTLIDRIKREFNIPNEDRLIWYILYMTLTFKKHSIEIKWMASRSKDKEGEKAFRKASECTIGDLMTKDVEVVFDE